MSENDMTGLNCLFTKASSYLKYTAWADRVARIGMNATDDG
jgi:hypothetical protein